MDFCHGKLLITAGKTSAKTSSVSPALLLDDRDIEFAFFGIPLDFGFRERFKARAFQKALHGGIGRADPRPALFLARIRLPGRQTCDVQGEPPGRGEAHGALMRKAALAQGSGDEPAEILGRPRLHAGGDFLGKSSSKRSGIVAFQYGS